MTFRNFYDVIDKYLVKFANSFSFHLHKNAIFNYKSNIIDKLIKQIITFHNIF